ncbi:hypothetical protein NMG60_11032735 [Bertholletia excelsa]
MGKKAIKRSAPASTTKICKDPHLHLHLQQDKKHLQSLIKVLRPKVYITDSCSFKALVQQLTGNSNNDHDVPPTSSSPVIIDLDNHHHREESCSTQLNSRSTPMSVAAAMDGVDQTQSIYAPSAASASEESLSSLAIPDHVQDHHLGVLQNNNTHSSSQLKDLETWLLEFDHHHYFPYFDGSNHVPLALPEIDVYNYNCNFDFSGLI